jgi:putative copper export protein
MTGGWAELLVPSDAVAVLNTHFGRIWILRLALAAGILGLVVIAKKDRGRGVAYF